jgi:thioredoxin reductase
MERHCDVAVIGGSAAGLAAALQIARQRRSVIVVDAGEPRNAPAAHMHGYLGHEGLPPSGLTSIGRAEVRGYGGEVLDGRATEVTRNTDGRFRVALTGGHSLVARRVLAATGLVDELPAIDGVAEHWGHDVVHCPFCHGYEIRDLPTVQIVTQPLGLHSALLFRHLTEQFTVVLHDWPDDVPAEADHLRAGGVEVLSGHVRRIVTDADGGIAAVELDGHDPLPARAVVVTPRVRVRAEPFAALGLHPTQHASGIGDHLATDARGQTDIAGVYAAGNVTDPSHQVLHAAADGSRIGAMICADLAGDDLSAGTRTSGNATDWEHRYGGEQIWSGNPNGTLVHEAAGLPPGRALDVGAGEGADAIWLAEHGWEVTANDIARPALDRADAEARRRGLAIGCLVADANAPSPSAASASTW